VDNHQQCLFTKLVVCGLALFVEHLEISRGTYDELFCLPLGHLAAGPLVDVLDGLVSHSAPCFVRYPLTHGMRIQVGGQVELFIHRKKRCLLARSRDSVAPQNQPPS
jgi:hypothetical protein